MSFSIEHFVSLSKAVETSDLDWDYIARVGITKDEADWRISRIQPVLGS